MKPMVSVVIPLFNGGKYISHTIQSVLAQTYPNMEIIVVDDGSTDRGAEIAESHPGVSLIRQGNRGISGARNTGIRAAKGEFISLLDQDDLFKPLKTEIQVAFLEKHPEYCMVYTPEERFGDSEPVRRVSRHHMGRRNQGDLLIGLYGRNFITPSSTLIRRGIFDASGLFDEGMAVCEEHDLFIRISYHGLVGFIGEPLIEYRWHGENTSSRLSRLMPFNELRIYRRYLPMLRTRTRFWPFIYLYRSAKAQRDMGIACLRDNEYKPALRHLAASFVKSPWRIKTIRNLAKAAALTLKGSRA